ncbi:uncharacterized protein LOC114544035 [Dendronephthya gigantea]|uniref:uncharacterized protein LOC114544035 n=1 Tax=Dendronephthya gigantea TaxID=151771 RepID=UPI00106C15AD|nr:uncharacterized protein LOC114544035 [Dendronephthya gigantea]
MERLPPDTITEREITSFQEDGAICLRAVFCQKWVDLLRKGIEHNRLHPSEKTKRKGHSPLFFHDYDNWEDIPEYKEFLLHSPVAEVAGRLSRSAKIALYSNHVIVKDSGSTVETPWHQDQAYYEVDGQQVCSVWLAVDPVTEHTCLRLVKGSHKSPNYFKPVHFNGPLFSPYEIKPGKEEQAKEFLSPDFDGNDQYQILSWNMEPGDCIVFHMKTVHSAHGNNLQTPRRAFSTRWLGDDAVKGERPWMNLPPSTQMNGLVKGDKLVDSGSFPVVWNA